MLIIKQIAGRKNNFKIWHQCILEYFCTPKKRDDSVAQLVEHYTFNVGVLGSNPSGITRKISKSLKTSHQFVVRFLILVNFRITSLFAAFWFAAASPKSIYFTKIVEQ